MEVLKAPTSVRWSIKAIESLFRTLPSIPSDDPGREFQDCTHQDPHIQHPTSSQPDTPRVLSHQQSVTSTEDSELPQAESEELPTQAKQLWIPGPEQCSVPSLPTKEVLLETVNDATLGVTTGTAAGTTNHEATDITHSQDTAPTKVLTQPQSLVLFDKKIYTAPCQDMDPEIRQRWETQIKERLKNELSRHGHGGVLMTECYLAGRKPKKLKPTIIVTCDDAISKQRNEKVLKKCYWLKEHKLPCKVVTNTNKCALVLYALGSWNESSAWNKMVIANIHAVQPTLCGIKAAIEGLEQFSFRLGGLLLVDDDVLCLTAGHSVMGGPLQDHQAIGTAPNNGARSSIQSSTRESASDLSSNSGKDSDASEESEDEHSDDDGDDGPLPTLSTEDFVSETTLDRQSWSPIGRVCPVMQWQSYSDWALIRVIDPQHWLCNVAQVAGESLTHIEKIRPESAITSEQVWAITDWNNPRAGTISPTSSNLFLQERAVSVRLIVFERALSPGDSGAWIIQDGHLCGLLVAGRTALKWAYMVPIEIVFQEIRESFKTSNVRLLKRSAVWSMTPALPANTAGASQPYVKATKSTSPETLASPPRQHASNFEGDSDAQEEPNLAVIAVKPDEKVAETPASGLDSRMSDFANNWPCGNPIRDANDTRFEVSWNGPEGQDPQNPRNWSRRKKCRIVAILFTSGFFSSCVTSMFAPSVPQVVKEFSVTSQILATFVVSVSLLGFFFGVILLDPLRELIGRKILCDLAHILYFGVLLGCGFSINIWMLICFRLLTGLAGCAINLCINGFITDMFTSDNRARAIGTLRVVQLLGPIIGPVIGGVLIQFAGWRWVFWIPAIPLGVLFFTTIAVVPETYEPILLARKAAGLRRATGDTRYRPKFEANLEFPTAVRAMILNTTNMLFLSPVITTTCICNGTLYGIHFIIYTTISFVYQRTYGFSPLGTGLSFLSGAIGILLGTFIAGTFKSLSKQLRPTNWKYRHMHRVVTYLKLLCTITPSIGLVIFGWAADKMVPWIVPMIGTGIIGFGTTATCIWMSLHLAAACKEPVQIATALRLEVMFTSLFSALLPLCGLILYDNLGLGWGSSLLAFIALAMAPIFGALGVFGRRIGKYDPVRTE